MINYSLAVFFLAPAYHLSAPGSKTRKLLNVFNMVVVNFPNDDCVSDSGTRGVSVRYCQTCQPVCVQVCVTRLLSAPYWVGRGAGPAPRASECAAPSAGRAGACPGSTTPTSPGPPALTTRPAPSR